MAWSANSNSLAAVRWEGLFLNNRSVMTEYFDDNFGRWDDMNDPDMVEFYHQVQEESVEKECQGCHRKVKIRPQYAYCNSCADKIERGMDIG